MHRLLALAFAAWFIVPVHAEEWDWDIGYKRPGFVHHHHRNPHYVSDIDRERVRLYREEGLEAERRAEHREERRDEGVAASATADLRVGTTEACKNAGATELASVSLLSGIPCWRQRQRG